MYFLNNDYSLGEIFKMGYSFILTKLFNSSATLIRRPVYLRGRQRMRIGKGFTCGYRCRIETFGEKGDTSAKLVIKDNVHIGDSVHIAAAQNVVIEDNCLIASKVLITDLDHGNYSSRGGVAQSSPDSDPNARPLFTDPVHIGKNVWIGDNVCILKGVSLGDGSIVASNAVVTKSVDPATIVAGSPARPIKQYDCKSASWISIKP